jgi:beta-lactamase superfamily II metal-dependent hydrolase
MGVSDEFVDVYCERSPRWGDGILDVVDPKHWAHAWQRLRAGLADFDESDERSMLAIDLQGRYDSLGLTEGYWSRVALSFFDAFDLVPVPREGSHIFRGRLVERREPRVTVRTKPPVSNPEGGTGGEASDRRADEILELTWQCPEPRPREEQHVNVILGLTSGSSALSPWTLEHALAREVPVTWLHQATIRGERASRPRQRPASSDPPASAPSFAATTSVSWPTLKGRPLSLTVVDCGHGNWNEIHGGGWKLVYDTGADARYTTARLAQLVRSRELSFCKRLQVVLSHWDVDHYHALLGFNDDDFRPLHSVIAPHPTPGNATSTRVLQLLEHKRVAVQLIPGAPRPGGTGRKTVLVPLHTTGALEFLRAVQSRSRNQSGIILIAKGLRAEAILTGDHHYSQVAEVLAERRECQRGLVVPHHGGHAGSMSSEDWRAFGIAQCFISEAGRYQHPRTGVLRFLDKIAKTTKRTSQLPPGDWRTFSMRL